VSPSELEDFFLQEPIPHLRLTLSSGDQVIVRNEDTPFVTGFSLVLGGDRSLRRQKPGVRLVSIPNIVLVEAMTPRPPAGGRRR